MDDNGYITLATEIISAAVDDYKSILHRYKKSRSDTERRKYEYDLAQLERFFRDSPLMGVLPVSAEEIIKKLKKQEGANDEEEQ